MKVAALYDVHGMPHPLEAVLREVEAERVDAVVFGGDVVAGPLPRETLDLARSVDGALFVRGNAERAPDEWLRARLAPEDVESIGVWPETVELDGVLYCHATPRADNEMVTRISTPERYATVLAGVANAVVVAGHTHQQHDVTVGDVRFLNAGSVGMPYEGDGAARWLWVADGVPELRRTEYDSLAAGRRMLAAWPDARSLNASLVEPVEPIVVTDIFEGMIHA